MNKIVLREKMERAFVDVQGFKNNSNKFILKEIAVLTNNSSFHDVIRSPFSIEHLNAKQKKQTKWLTNNYHGIDWNDGTLSMTKLRKIIEPMLHQKVIFVNGSEKIQWIRFILGDKKNRIKILDLNCVNQTRKYKNKRICKKHSIENFCCALENVIVLAEYFIC